MYNFISSFCLVQNVLGCRLLETAINESTCLLTDVPMKRKYHNIISATKFREGMVRLVPQGSWGSSTLGLNWNKCKITTSIASDDEQVPTISDHPPFFPQIRSWSRECSSCRLVRCMNFICKQKHYAPTAFSSNYNHWCKQRIVFLLQELWSRKDLKLISKPQVIVIHPNRIMCSTSLFSLML